jgi:raffinose/stachyose/melibiose transport system substrate-binding protein
MYNQTALAKHGLQIPRTWSQVLALCSAAKAKGITAYALGAQTDFENQMLPFLLIGTLVDRVYPNFNVDRAAGKVTFTGSPWKTAFEYEQTMLHRGCFQSPDGTSINAAESQVAQQQALGMFGLSVQVSDLQAQAKGQEIAVTTLPATNNPADTRMPVALGASFSINAQSKNAALAEKFLDFLQEPAVLSAFATATGQVPAIADPSFKPTSATAEQVKYQADGKATPVDDQFFPNPNVRLAWITENEKMLAGQASPSDITKAMDAAYGSKS